MIKLDLGSGPNPREGFQGVDIVQGLTDHCFNLCSGKTWPFNNDSIDELYSSHFIEHILCGHILIDGFDYKDALFFFFDEAYRIAKPGAIFTVQWPALQSIRAFQDPTHRRYIPLETMLYMSREGREELRVSRYNVYCNWRIIKLGHLLDRELAENVSPNTKLWNEIADYHAVLEKI